jgi:peptidoglycan/xylan/chitin deacetylase (PgdA/CDA1 family)
MKTLKNNFYQGIMFHHFHDNKIFKKSQGSINKNQFYKIIKIIGRKNILNANDFYEKLKLKKLKNNQTCLTFDDGLKCQYSIALPLLEDLNIKAFFFINTSIYEGNYQMLEIFRYFRTNYFKSIDQFYEIFFNNLQKNILDKFFKKNEVLIKNKLNLFPFYSLNDVKFRFVRDYLLNQEDYTLIMKKIFRQKKFNVNSVKKLLYFSKNELKNLDKKGHIIGLHSHNHPTRISDLSYGEQLKQYKQNQLVLSKILNKNTKDIKFMSHPCGDYNQNTLKILKQLNIKLGFLHNLEKKGRNNFKIPRINHANIVNNYF